MQHSSLDDRHRSGTPVPGSPVRAASGIPGVSIWSAPAAGSSGSGDWCEVVEISAEVVALTIGDFAGHGDPAVDARTAVRRSVLSALQFMRTPSDVLAAANACIANRPDVELATAIVAFYDRTRRTLAYANAGHPHPLLVAGASASFLWPLRADMPLGVYASHNAQNYTIALPPGSVLVLYTDGVTERERDPVRGEIELAKAAQLADGVADTEYASAIAGNVFEAGRGHDDAAILALHTALAAMRRPRAAGRTHDTGVARTHDADSHG